ncbi:hypothetical protein THAOC_12269 [Thalassiosira oceanica]|uniref:Transcription factor CBF/NF-Y/archaeal histone domain-containing protein n=1 Tax=Thalassiosira oceanica TaxID=159749 RepID=K0SN44_THAOC|nr:hypothetical protein THAOC_12269 [Thalassiosira oceanica]|mmetsp:Transcript_36465/g.83184  ORF Transcript_36465/g.83184 Transcript_36465/m.83184 type:complete len:186 (-) Transcript_36465:1805-2362(-)|eukprot:EJK66775.1 hypothetical protein THAOC_12269 [Thalassiosira oceanica]
MDESSVDPYQSDSDDDLPVASIVEEDDAEDTDDQDFDAAAVKAADLSSASLDAPQGTNDGAKTPASGNKRPRPDDEEGDDKGGKAQQDSKKSSSKPKRTPPVGGTVIPFRTIKKLMKRDPDVAIIQNDAALLVTAAMELFAVELAKKAQIRAEKRPGAGSTIRYSDVAEARIEQANHSFLNFLLP